jgi:hypothetical protein
VKEKVCNSEAPLPTGEAPALSGLRVCGVAATELSPNNMTSYLQSCERRTRHLRGAFVSHSSFCEEVLSRVFAGISDAAKTRRMRWSGQIFWLLAFEEVESVW